MLTDGDPSSLPGQTEHCKAIERILDAYRVIAGGTSLVTERIAVFRMWRTIPKGTGTSVKWKLI
jgi:hypothetical protein